MHFARIKDESTSHIMDILLRPNSQSPLHSSENNRQQLSSFNSFKMCVFHCALFYTALDCFLKQIKLCAFNYIILNL